MKKKRNNLANEYYYSSNPKDEGFLEAVRHGRCYKTKMRVSDLPEWYCDVHRYWWTRNVISCKGVVDVVYTWVRENHFMKDSMLRISYRGKIVESESKCGFGEWENVDCMVFGGEVFKALAWIRKWSGVDLGEVRKKFIEQCEWLRDNEPSFAPDAEDYGKWFDERLEEEINDKA